MPKTTHAFVLLAALAPAAASAQNTGRLSRLILDLYGPQGLIVESESVLPSGQTHSAHFNSAFQSEFTQFNVAIASQLATVPIPSPASGFTYEFDTEAGVFVRSTQSFGPILAERAETIGRGKVSLGFNYQRFSFDELEGLDLGNIAAVFTHDGAEPGGKADVVTTANSIDATLDQFTLFGTVGVTNWLDLTVALPLARTDLEIVSKATVVRIGTASNPAVHFFEEPGVHFGEEQTFRASGSASGIGDVHILTKATVFKREKTAFAVGLDLRVPSGDELDLLGAGAVGLRPYAAWSMSRDIYSTHLNFAYQWNGDSVLAGDLNKQTKGPLPNQLDYVAGVDIGLHPNVTIVLDVLGKMQYDAPRLVSQTFTALDGKTTFGNIAFNKGTITQTSAATGIKINVLDKLLLDANVLFALDEGGLRDRVTPLVGFEYSF